MASPFFSGRIPQDLYDKAGAFIKESGKTKTEILIEALANYLQHPIESQKPAGNEDLWNAIKELQEKVKLLETKVSKTLVIEADNNQNNNKYDQLPLLQEIQEVSENNEESTKSLEVKTIKTNEIPSLPGLENKNPDTIKTQLRNAKSQGKTPIKIGRYLLDVAGKEPGSKGALLWKIVQDNL